VNDDELEGQITPIAREAMLRLSRTSSLAARGRADAAALPVPTTAPVIDIMEALKKRIAAKRAMSDEQRQAERQAELLQWHALADQGDIQAQKSLAFVYYFGQGMTQNYAEAAKWYRKAAEQGDTAAQFALYEMYYEGRGVAQDCTEALRWCRKAAEQGDDGAGWALGCKYYYGGQGVPQDYGEAAKWFRKVAERGNPSAQIQLGDMCHDGQGVPQDFTEAVRWYQKAAEHDDTFLQDCLNGAHEKGIPEDDHLVASLRAIQQGYAEAQLKLGAAYSTGQGIRQDHVEAAKWFRRAAEQHNALGQSILGLLHWKGQGVGQDYAQAYMWMRLAASHSDCPSRDEYVKACDAIARKMSPAQLAEAERLAREWRPAFMRSREAKGFESVPEAP
jgi:TPR repeat protein